MSLQRYRYIVVTFICIFVSFKCIHLNDLLVFPAQFTETNNYDLDTILDGYVDSLLWDTVSIKKNEISLNGLWIKSNKDSQNILSKYAFLYFDGNSSNLVYTAKVGKVMHKTGMNFLGIEYRGYGKSYGSAAPSEKTLFADGTAALLYLTENLGIKIENIFVVSFSIGSIVAVEISQKTNFKGVFLMAPLSSAEYLADRISGGFNLNPEWITDSKLDNLSKIGNIKSPICFIHGKNDATIPYHSSMQLFEKANQPKNIYLNDNDHMELLLNDKYWLPLLEQFVNSTINDKSK